MKKRNSLDEMDEDTQPQPGASPPPPPSFSTNSAMADDDAGAPAPVKPSFGAGAPSPAATDEDWEIPTAESEAPPQVLWRSVTVAVSATIGGNRLLLGQGQAVPMWRYGHLKDMLLRRKQPVTQHQLAVEWFASVWSLPEGATDLSQGGLVLEDGYVLPYAAARSGQMSAEERRHLKVGGLHSESVHVVQRFKDAGGGISVPETCGGPIWDYTPAVLQSWLTSQAQATPTSGVPMRPAFWGAGRKIKTTHVLLDMSTKKQVAVAPLPLAVSPVPMKLLGEKYDHSAEDIIAGVKMILQEQGVTDIWFGYACDDEKAICTSRHINPAAWPDKVLRYDFPHLPGNRWYGLRFDAEPLLTGAGQPEPVYL